MPPKGKKGKKGKKLPVLIDGVDTSSMTRDQLEAFALRLKAEMDREREERNYFQLERDKIHSFWEINREELEKVKSDVHLKAMQVDSVQKTAYEEVKKIRNEMKYIAYEMTCDLGETRAEAMTQLKIAQENHSAQEMQLLKDKRELRRMLRECNDMRNMQVRQIVSECNEKMLEQQFNFDYELRNHINMLTERMNEQQDQVVLFYRTQLAELEERKNTQIKRLQTHHNKTYIDMKNYYREITITNMNLITALKEEMEKLRRLAHHKERVAHNMKIENRRLKKPLEKTRSELRDLRSEFSFYQRDQAQMTSLEKRNETLRERNKLLSWENDALKLHNETLIGERDNFKQHFSDVISELQQNISLKNVLLEHKIEDLEMQNEKYELLLKEIEIRNSPDGAHTRQNMETRIENALYDKTQTIIDLRYQLAAAQNAHDRLLDAYECKMKELGISTAANGFTAYRKKPQKEIKDSTDPAKNK